LEQAETASPIRTETNLQPGEELALNPNEVGGRQEQDNKNDSKLYDK
jgi:hypothetical protein